MVGKIGHKFLAAAAVGTGNQSTERDEEHESDGVQAGHVQ